MELIGGAAWRMQPRLRARSANQIHLAGCEDTTSSHRSGLPANVSTLGCRNNPSQLTQTGPLPYDRKNKGPSGSAVTKARTDQCAVRLNGC